MNRVCLFSMTVHVRFKISVGILTMLQSVRCSPVNFYYRFNSRRPTVSTMPVSRLDKYSRPSLGRSLFEFFSVGECRMCLCLPKRSDRVQVLLCFFFYSKQDGFVAVFFQCFPESATQYSLQCAAAKQFPKKLFSIFSEFLLIFPMNFRYFFQRSKPNLTEKLESLHCRTILYEISCFFCRFPLKNCAKIVQKCKKIV